MAFSFIKTGTDSAAIAKQDAVEMEHRKEQQGKLFRFYIGVNEDARITFVDGDLSAEGHLLPPRWYEHMIAMGGGYSQFVCPEKTVPELKQSCPLCEAGDRPSLVAAFTVIDHRVYKSKRGNEYRNTRKLFICKPKTFEYLSKLAQKRNGLTGCTFDVTRTSSTDAGVGGQFDFVDKQEVEKLKELFTYEKTDPKSGAKTKVTNFIPAVYDEEIIFRSGDELRALGLSKPGTGGTPSGFGMSPSGSATQADYSKEM
jgi:hypothetical protein